MELQILKRLFDKQTFDEQNKNIKPELFSNKRNSPIWKIFAALREYYEKNENTIAPEDFRRIHAVKIQGLSEKEQERILNVYSQLEEETDSEEATEALFREFRLSNLRYDIQEALEDGEDNEAERLFAMLREAEAEEEDLFSSLDIVEIVEANSGEGLESFLPELREFLPRLTYGTGQLVVARSNAGKCLGKDTPVIMADGSMKMVQDIKDGELVMGSDSTPRTVQGTTSGRAPMYRVSYKDGDSYTVNDAHILSLKKVGTDEIVNINVEDYLKKSNKFKTTHKGWRAKWDGGITDTSMPSPYFIGLWLGDGTSSKPEITNSSEVIRDLLYSFFDVTPTLEEGKAPRYYLKGFKQDLRKLNLLNNKHIPAYYKMAGVKTRQHILAGLVDTDGYVGEHSVEITQKSKQLADDIVWVARSLGIRATVKPTWKKAQGWTEKKQYWRISLRGDLNQLPCRLKDVSHISNNKGGDRYAITVEPIGEDVYYGFTLKEDPLFVLGDWTVTHNTSFLTPQAMHVAKGGGRVLHFALSEDGQEELVIRYMQAAYGASENHIRNNMEAARDRFLSDYGDSVRIFNTGTCHYKELEKRIEAFKPNLVIYDQYQKVITSTNSNMSSPELRTKAASVIKDLAIKHQHHYICATQADKEAGWVVTDLNIDQAKTGVVGEFKTIIGLGKEDDDRLRTTPSGKMGLLRNINIAKNKGKMGSFTAYLQPDVCKWETTNV